MSDDIICENRVYHCLGCGFVGREKEANDHPVAIEHRYFEDHTELRDQVEQFKKIYNELKQNFMRFLSKWM